MKRLLMALDEDLNPRGLSSTDLAPAQSLKEVKGSSECLLLDSFERES
jgi:hypothetical protein